MLLTVAETVELVEVFEARLIGDRNEPLAIACGSSLNVAKEYARELMP